MSLEKHKNAQRGGPIKVLLVDDHLMILDSLQYTLEANEGIEIVGVAQNGRQAVEFTDQEEVDVIVMDVKMPIMNGVEATKVIKEHHPDIEIVILTDYGNVDVIKSLIYHGVSGYLQKSCGVDELIKAIYNAGQGDEYFSKSVTDLIIQSFRKKDLEEDKRESSLGLEETVASKITMLSPREIEILKLIAEGKKVVEIAKELQIAISTIHAHRKNIMVKMGFKNEMEVLKFALKEKLIQME